MWWKIYDFSKEDKSLSKPHFQVVRGEPNELWHIKKETVKTTMGPGKVLENRPNGVKVVRLDWKLANNSPAILYTSQTL